MGTNKTSFARAQLTFVMVSDLLVDVRCDGCQSSRRTSGRVLIGAVGATAKSSWPCSSLGDMGHGISELKATQFGRS